MQGAETHKLCPSCGTPVAADAAFCQKCGHAFRTQLPPSGPPKTQAFTPPQAQPHWNPPLYGGPGAAQGYPPPFSNLQPAPPLDWQLGELARRYRDAHNVFVWTLIGGILCIWPLWIITYLEHQKKVDIKNSVAALGVDVEGWRMTYRLS